MIYHPNPNSNRKINIINIHIRSTGTVLLSNLLEWDKSYRVIAYKNGMVDFMEVDNIDGSF